MLFMLRPSGLRKRHKSTYCGYFWIFGTRPTSACISTAIYNMEARAFSKDPKLV